MDMGGDPSTSLLSIQRKKFFILKSFFISSLFFTLPALFILDEHRYQDQNKCELVANRVK